MSTTDTATPVMTAEDIRRDAFDALAHLEAALNKLLVCGAYATPPESGQLREWTDELTGLCDEVREYTDAKKGKG